MNKLNRYIYALGFSVLTFAFSAAYAQEDDEFSVVEDSSFEDLAIDTFDNNAGETAEEFSPPVLDKSYLRTFKKTIKAYVAEHSEGSVGPKPYQQGMDDVPKHLLVGLDQDSVKVQFAILKSGRVAGAKVLDDVSGDLKIYIEAYVNNWLFYPLIKNGEATDIPKVRIPLVIKTAEEETE